MSKGKVQCYIVGPTIPINSHPFHFISFCPPIPEIVLFQNLTLKSKVKLMSKAKVQGYKVGPAIPINSHPFCFISFCPLIPEIVLFQNLTSKSRPRSYFKVTKWVQHNVNSYLCCSNYIFDLTPGFNGLGEDNCKARRETFKFWDLVWLILEVWMYQ